MAKKDLGPMLWDGLFEEHEPIPPAAAPQEVQQALRSDIEQLLQIPETEYDETQQEAPDKNYEFSLFGRNLFGEAVTQAGLGPLASRFTLPPFTILDARQGPWRERKRAWLALGIQSELGRISDAVFTNQSGLWRLQKTGVSQAAHQEVGQEVQVTPIERRGDIWIKRDDLFEIAGVRGGKVRTCCVLAQAAIAQGATGLVTAGSRSSPQANIVAQIAKLLGVPCRVHVPQGELSPEVAAAKLAGAEVIQHHAGYNTVIVKRAKDDADTRGWACIPFGMECDEAVRQTAGQVHNLPPDISRIVVPVGSGMSLAGVLHGLTAMRHEATVLAVQVGADPIARLHRYAPAGWPLRVTLVKSELDYHSEAPETTYHGLALDPIYEAKCLPFLQPNDLFWIVGIRQTAT